MRIKWMLANNMAHPTIEVARVPREHGQHPQACTRRRASTPSTTAPTTTAPARWRVLEIAEACRRMKVKPKRSTLFIWHTGEEGGPVGSAFFTRNPTVPMDSVVAQLNIDMIGRGREGDLPGGGPPTIVGVVGSFFDSKDLGETVKAVNTKQAKPLTLDYKFDDSHLLDRLQQHLRPQRSLQLRRAGCAHRVLLHGIARRLPPADRRSRSSSTTRTTRASRTTSATSRSKWATARVRASTGRARPSHRARPSPEGMA
jgi:hypothetical protein